MLSQMSMEYDVVPDYVLDMYRPGKVNWMLDIMLRFAVLIGACIMGLTIQDFWKKRRQPTQNREG